MLVQVAQAQNTMMLPNDAEKRHPNNPRVQDSNWMALFADLGMLLARRRSTRDACRSLHAKIVPCEVLQDCHLVSVLGSAFQAFVCAGNTAESQIGEVHLLLPVERLTALRAWVCCCAPTTHTRPNHCSFVSVGRL